ncbi:MAG TPA: hypothetical protein VF721_19055 [Pyrinomonadaceae bacterium]|jgi:hypothetical protein
MKITTPILVFVFALFASIQAFAQCENRECGLVIRGKVTDIVTDRSDKNYVRFRVKLDVEFANEGSQPIILFKPDNDENGYWLGGWSLYQTEEDAKNWKSIFHDGYWQSISGSEDYRKLAEKLDVKTPPDDYTKILQPKEVWNFADDFQITFDTEKSSSFPVRKTWKEMQQLSSLKLQLRIVYELSPWNVEYFKKNLIPKLQKRWKSYGNILLEKEKSRFNTFRLASEPMMIDFSEAKEKKVESK